MDRNKPTDKLYYFACVALRKESVDRNSVFDFLDLPNVVALRKESVDRNRNAQRTS